MSKLVIVESPAKAKTIKKYLGKGYDVVASMGHIRDLPHKKISVDIKNNFKPEYAISEGKERLVKKLTEKAKKSSEVILATDPDREGEAISWHIAKVLGLDLDKKNRVAFNEITKTGIKEGMDNPKKIDMALVDAQQARRVLDRIVGYKLSPFLWNKIKMGLSAGRVQSVALKLVVDREKEIEKFVPEESFTIDAILEKLDKKARIEASFYGIDGKKTKLEDKKLAQEILKNVKEAEFIVKKVKIGNRKKSPTPPFITSTLQQEASRKLSFRPKRTMQIAQQLYEGIDIKGMGLTGIITYMRTDSLRVSDIAVNEIRDYINQRYGENYLPSKPRAYKNKNKAQDAHEAIRPSIPSLTPDKIKDSLTIEQYKLYKLIWSRFAASQMNDCIHDTAQADITADKYLFKASGFKVKFDGFTVLYEEDKDEAVGNNSELFNIKAKEELKPVDIKCNRHLTQPPARYSEATLIKAMEKNGIGRPSTYATIVTTITNREYVTRESKNLKPTELGEVVTDLLSNYFKNIVDVEFTAGMENDLDKVEEGKVDWVNNIKDFYEDFEKTLKQANKKTKGLKIELESDKTDIICEKCGKPMKIKQGRFGKFLGCTGYPECKNIVKLNKDGSVKQEQNKEEEKTDIVCPTCGAQMIIKQGRFGKFLGCSNYPKCKHIENLNEDGSIKTKEQMEEETKTDEICSECGKPMVVKFGKFGKFLGCSGYPECKNIKNLDIEINANCPKCGSKLVQKRTRKRLIFYGCSKYPDCDYSTWDTPIEDKTCPRCNKMLLKDKKGKVYCSDENCGYVEEKEK